MILKFYQDGDYDVPYIHKYKHLIIHPDTHFSMSFLRQNRFGFTQEVINNIICYTAKFPFLICLIAASITTSTQVSSD